MLGPLHMYGYRWSLTIKLTKVINNSLSEDIFRNVFLYKSPASTNLQALNFKTSIKWHLRNTQGQSTI